MKRIISCIAAAMTVLGCSVSSQVSGNISNQPRELSDDEKVSNGYSEFSKENSTTSISRVVVNDKYVMTYRNMTEYLTGRVPGVQVGGDGKIRIRGIGSINSSTDPLIIVDGIEGVDINSVNPNDVKTVDVLKDGSAAIYGARGANGVIIIRTKTGR